MGDACGKLAKVEEFFLLDELILGGFELASVFSFLTFGYFQRHWNPRI